MRQFTQKELSLCLFPLLLGAFIAMFSEMSLNVALSTLMKEFDITASTVQWLTTGYMLVISILLPTTASLLQWFSIRKLFLVSVGIFMVGTLVSALAPDFTILLIGRLIQAIGTGVQIPLIINTVLLIVPVEKRGSVMGMVGLVILFAPAIAPTLAGLILNLLSWQWLFWLLLPFLILALVLGFYNIQNVSTLTKPCIDSLSILLSSVSFGFLIYGLNSLGERSGGWSNSVTLLTVLVGGTALVFFIWRQLKLKEPMLNLRVFQYPVYAIGAAIIALTMLIIFAFLILIPLYLQNGLGQAAFFTGILLLPGGLLNGFISPIAGKLFDRLGPRRMAMPGMIMVAAMLYFAANFDQYTNPYLIIAMHCIFMTGISMIMMPVQTNSVNQLPPRLYAHGTAILSTLQQLAGAAGTALSVSIMAAGQRSYLIEVSSSPANGHVTNALIFGIQNAFGAIFILAVFGIVLTFFLKPAKKVSKS